MKMLRLFWLLPLLLAAPACAAQPPQQTPQSFLKALYAHYAPGQPDFSATGKAADTLFAPSLLALIRRDQAVPPGEEGRLDSDPVCACQDYDGFVPQSITVTAQTSGTAHAAVRFSNGGQETTVVYTLVERRGHWRIDDIADPAMPSLRAFLAASP